MKIRLLILVIVAACGLGLRADQSPTPAKDRHVILVSLDGFPAAALDHPRAPIPTLRRLIREGAVASALRPVNPVVTWPNHTSLVTGVPPAVHGVLFNGLIERPTPGAPPTVEPWRDKRVMVRAPTVYDAAHAAGLTTAQVDWVAIHNAETITWAFPERPDPAGAVERELVEAGVMTAEEIASFGKGSTAPWRDQRWTDAAVHIVERHRPNLLLYHLLALDSTHHRYGPGTLASWDAIAFQDGQVARVLAAMERAGLADQTTVLVVSDHGFRTASRTVAPNVALRAAGLITGTGGTAELSADAWTLSWGGAAGVYLREPGDAELLARARRALTGLEGVAQLLEADEIAALGLPRPGSMDQAPDLVLVAAEGYDFSGRHQGEPVQPTADDHLGHHGALASDPTMRALFVAWGEGVTAGTRLGEVDNIDIAPTVAEWLGVALPTADGKSLAAALAGAAEPSSR